MTVRGSCLALFLLASSQLGAGEALTLAVSAGALERRETPVRWEVPGIARLLPLLKLTRVEDGESLQQGEILVTTVTNIGWTPLFTRAAAVVTDVGAPLSHAAIVARELNIRVIETISVKSYDHKNQTEAQVLKGLDAGVGDGLGVLVIDDLVDTGKTLEVVRKLLPRAHFATVYAKPKGRPLVDTFITEVSQDTWIYFPWDMAMQYVEPLRGT